jgi:hypothetical protein
VRVDSIVRSTFGVSHPCVGGDARGRIKARAALDAQCTDAMRCMHAAAA